MSDTKRAGVTIIEETADFSAMKPRDETRNIPGVVLMSTSNGPTASPTKKPISQIGQVLGEVFK